MVAATEAASAAAETEAATETEAEAAMIRSPNAHPALATGRRMIRLPHPMNPQQLLDTASRIAEG